MRHLRRPVWIVTLCLGIAVPFLGQVAGARAQAAGEARLILGILPILSPERLMRLFGPLADYLSRTLGVPVVLETARDYREFVRRTVGERRYDLLFTAPHFYYLAQRDAGYRVVIRVSGPQMSAVIVAPKASRIFALKDLRGRSVATPDSLALGTLLIRHSLVAAGLDPGVDVELVETPTHNASLLSAVKGFSDAAGLMVVPFDGAAPEVKERVRVIAETKSTTQMPFSVAPWVPADQAEAFALLEETPDVDLLITDMVLPGGMTGRDLAAEVERRFGVLKVLFMSGYSSEAVHLNGWVEKGTDLLRKPFRRYELATKVRAVLDRSPG